MMSNGVITAMDVMVAASQGVISGMGQIWVGPMGLLNGRTSSPGVLPQALPDAAQGRLLALAPV